MYKILDNNNKVITLLGKQKINFNIEYRFINFCIKVNAEKNTIIYNNLTKQMILIEDESLTNNTLFKYDPRLDLLIQNWFLVPVDNDDNKLSDQLCDLARMFRNVKGYSHYTIFPTMDCNARCFYCFEHGSKRYHMDDKIALDTAKFISKTHIDKTIEILWFGGEPLYNSKAINIICDYLTKNNIKYSSNMITNGYLFSGKNIKLAKGKWNIKNVQITLDGTEEVYNKCKSYIYKEDKSPYQTVMNNIKTLLDNNISVDIRLNMSLSNEKDLYNLIDELHIKFADNKKIYVYAWLLYDNRGAVKHIKSIEEKSLLTKKLIDLEEYITQKGLKKPTYPNTKIKLERCTADSDFAVTILPNGNLGKCDHHSEDEIIGNIYSDAIDRDVIKNWKIRDNNYELCKKCPLYTTCIKLKKCPDDYQDCDYFDQMFKLEKMKREIINAYNLKKNEIDSSAIVTEKKQNIGSVFPRLR